MNPCKLLIFLSLFFGIQITTLGQEYYELQPSVPPSPNAASLSRFANIPVNLNVGVANISIPIYSLKNIDYSLNIELNYHASGNKVQDIASWVGLAWNLQAGGAITRTMRGLPDEEENGYCGTNQRGSEIDNLSESYLDNVLKGEWDAEADIFYFSFNGISGKFVLDYNGNPIFLNNEKNYHLVPAICQGSTNTWVLTDHNGYKYIFGKSEGHREISTSKLIYESDEDAETFVSTWYLSEIITPGNKIFEFSYSTGPEITYSYHRMGRSDLVAYDNVSGLPEYAEWNADVEVRIENPRYLEQIITNSGKVVFTTSQDRADLANGLRLNKISMYDTDNNLIMDHELAYDYFSTPGCSSQDCKRLKLETLSRVSGGQRIEDFKFSYNGITPPSRRSYQIDHWGYYNNNQYNSLIPEVTEAYEGYHAGADKDPDATKCLFGLLEKIEYPHGGSLEIEYGSHDYRVPNSADKILGGARVERTIQNFGNGKTSTKTYKYVDSNGNSSGRKFSSPVYYHYIRSISTAAAAYVYMRRHSHSLAEMFDLDGYHVSYDRVEEHFDDGSSKVFVYLNPSDEPAEKFVFNSSTILDENAPPFVPNSSKSNIRGLLISEEVYSDNSLIEKKTYNHTILPDNTVKGLRTDVETRVNGTPTSYRVGIYNNQISRAFLDSTTNEIYDQVISGKKVSTTTSYTYNADYPFLLTSSVSETPEGDEYRSTYKYPVDFFSPDALVEPSDQKALGVYKLVKEFRMNTPLETVHSLKKSGMSGFYVIGAELCTFRFKESLNRAVKFESYKLDINETISDLSELEMTNNSVLIDSRYRKLEEYEFNDFGNLSSIIGADGITKEYNWGYNNSLLTSLTTNPGIGEHVTQYAYQPGVGLTEVTDLNGLSTGYMYDRFNRLKIVKDDDNFILARYRYHLQNQELTPSIEVSGDYIRGSQMEFNAHNTSSDYGTNTYYWDFGDGTVYQGLASNVNHVYTVAGNYNVKLVVVNPEYITKTENIAIDIVPPLSVSRTNLSYSYWSGTKSVGVTSPASDFTVSDNASWITISNVTSTNFQVNVTSNAGNTNSRSGTVTVSNSRATINIPVSQAGDDNPNPGTCPPGCFWNATLQSCVKDDGSPCNL